MAAGGRDPVASRSLVRCLAYCATSSYIIHDISKIQITSLTESPPPPNGTFEICTLWNLKLLKPFLILIFLVINLRYLLYHCSILTDLLYSAIQM